MGWDYVRIEPSAAEPENAALYLMKNGERWCEIMIACLPIRGEPCHWLVTEDPNWTLALDALAHVVKRALGEEEVLIVETSNGERWKHRVADD